MSKTIMVGAVFSAAGVMGMEADNPVNFDLLDKNAIAERKFRDALDKRGSIIKYVAEDLFISSSEDTRTESGTSELDSSAFEENKHFAVENHKVPSCLVQEDEAGMHFSGPDRGRGDKPRAPTGPSVGNDSSPDSRPDSYQTSPASTSKDWWEELHRDLAAGDGITIDKNDTIDMRIDAFPEQIDFTKFHSANVPMRRTRKAQPGAESNRNPILMAGTDSAAARNGGDLSMNFDNKPTPVATAISSDSSSFEAHPDFPPELLRQQNQLVSDAGEPDPTVTTATSVGSVPANPEQLSSAEVSQPAPAGNLGTTAQEDNHASAVPLDDVSLNFDDETTTVAPATSDGVPTEAQDTPQPLVGSPEGGALRAPTEGTTEVEKEGTPMQVANAAAAAQDGKPTTTTDGGVPVQTSLQSPQEGLDGKVDPDFTNNTVPDYCPDDRPEYALSKKSKFERMFGTGNRCKLL